MVSCSSASPFFTGGRNHCCKSSTGPLLSSGPVPSKQLKKLVQDCVIWNCMGALASEFLQNAQNNENTQHTDTLYLKCGMKLHGAQTVQTCTNGARQQRNSTRMLGTARVHCICHCICAMAHKGAVESRTSRSFTAFCAPMCWLRAICLRNCRLSFQSVNASPFHPSTSPCT